MCGNATQLRAKVKVTKDDLNTLKLKNLDLSESLRRASERLHEFTDVIQFIGKMHMPSQRCIGY
ncbi:hypothetical protein B0H13DRAFT_2315947 [Mycena leptocephala]|nr:hypothetical protein B0H13DRAFT_2315947 [Mycena leptocephala]